MSNSSINEFKILSKCLNGGLAGIIGVSCVFPVDLVKTRLQNQSNIKIYDSMIDCFRKTLKNEGLRGMYSGSAVNILLVTPEKAIKLASNDYFRHVLSDQNGKLTLKKEIVAGGGAGFCQIIITNPMELLKIQLQSAEKNFSKKMSASRIALNLIKEKGFFGLYRGTLSTMLRDVGFSLIYFPLFANLNRFGPKKINGEPVFYVSFFSGCASGSVSAFLVNPIDVVKTRLQLLKKNNDKVYDGISNAFKTIYKQEGITAFFKGAGCRMIVIAPLFGIAQTVYYLGVAEFILSYF